MDEMVGFLGGLMMTLLVLLFACLLLCETGLLPFRRDQLMNTAKLFGGWIFCGILILLAGALFRYLLQDGRPVLEVESVWQHTACALQWPLLRDGASFSMLAGEGVFPLTALLFRGLGHLLLGADQQAALYLGLICGGVSLCCADQMWKCKGIALCLPCCALVMLPSSFALMAAAALSALAFDKNGHKRAAMILGGLSILIHPFGIAAAIWMLLRIGMTSLRINRFLLLPFCALLCIVMGWQGCWLQLAAVAAAHLLPYLNVLQEKSWFPMLPAALALSSALTLGFMI